MQRLPGPQWDKQILITELSHGAPGRKTFCMLAAVSLSPQRVRQIGRRINETKQIKNTEKQKHLTEKEAIN